MLKWSTQVLENKSSTSHRLSFVSTHRSTLTLRSRRHTEADALVVSSASGLLQLPRGRRAVTKRRKSKHFFLFVHLLIPGSMSMSFLITMSLHAMDICQKRHHDCISLTFLFAFCRMMDGPHDLISCKCPAKGMSQRCRIDCALAGHATDWRLYNSALYRRSSTTTQHHV